MCVSKPTFYLFCLFACLTYFWRWPTVTTDQQRGVWYDYERPCLSVFANAYMTQIHCTGMWGIWCIKLHTNKQREVSVCVCLCEPYRYACVINGLWPVSASYRSRRGENWGTLPCLNDTQDINMRGLSAFRVFAVGLKRFLDHLKVTEMSVFLQITWCLIRRKVQVHLCQ